MDNNINQNDGNKWLEKVKEVGNKILKVAVNHNETTFTVDSDQDLTIIVNGNPIIASKLTIN